MAMSRLEFGDSLAGLLVDGVKETPYTGGTLKMQAADGVVIEVPYVRGDQFEHVETWFRKQSPPSNMRLITHEGTIDLFEVRWNGHSETTGRRASQGTLRPRETVLHPRDGAPSDPLVVTTVRSRIDGLNQWIRESSLSQIRHDDADGRLQKLDIEIQRVIAAEWLQNDAAMILHTDWSVHEQEDAYDRGSFITDNFVLESEFRDGARPFRDHLAEHRKVVNLLVFMFDNAIAFREHKVRHERFTERYGSTGKVYNHPFVELISSATVRERNRPIPDKDKLARPLAHLVQLGPDGLRTWAAEYDKWERFIIPSVSALGRSDAFAEEIVTSTSMSIEVAGELLKKQPGENATYSDAGNTTTATNVYRCLHALGIKWGDYVESDAGLARAIANNYNGVKHYDSKKRFNLPAGEESIVVSRVNSLVVRLLALRLTGTIDKVLNEYRNGNGLWPIEQQFQAYGLRVLNDGSWERTTSG
jgi:hypothetical protein